MRPRSPPWDQVTYWSLDLETGGLDPRRDPILAVGMVPIRAGTIRLADSYETLVGPPGDSRISAASMRAHHLLPADVRTAPALAGVLREIDRRLDADVLLVHQSAIDVAFLRRAHASLDLDWHPPRLVDTVDLVTRAASSRRFIDPSAAAIDPDLDLSTARRRLGLPPYPAHAPLSDAIAAAELFLVLRRLLRAETLRDLL